MWPFGSSKAEDPPNRTERAKCHGSRDVYFACLRAQHLAKLDPTATEVKFFVPGKEGDSVCKKEREAYHANCPASWVEHFNLKVIGEQRQAAMQAGGTLPSTRPPR